ncbi:MAG: NUDIX domain-containing protein [Oscillochloridaceae bacterium umkhey_bin13]
MRRGHDYIGVGVGAMIFNRQGQVFLAQRGPAAKNERGCWEFPGGTVEFGERLADAIVREIAEEHGVQITLLRLLCVNDHILPAEGQHWIAPTYLAYVPPEAGAPQILEPTKCSAIGWFDLDNLPAPLSQISQDDMIAYSAEFGLRPAWGG